MSTASVPTPDATSPAGPDRGAGALLRRPLVPPPPGLEDLRVRLALLGGSLFLGLLETAKEWAAARAGGEGADLAAAVLVNVPWWLWWGLAAPAVFALSARLARWDRSVLVVGAAHLAAAVACAALHLLTVTALGWYGVVRGGAFVYDTFGSQLGYLAVGYAIPDLVIYGLLVGTWYGLRSRGRLQRVRRREARYREEAERARARAAEARLSALRSELNPHFLFNALNGVSGLVRTGDTGGATTMLARLGDLLRITLQLPGTATVPLRTELELLRAYLDVEAARFGPRLRVEIEVPADLREAPVPPLIIQPLVENAVRHGVEGTPGRVRIAVEARSEGEDGWMVAVSDGGPGFGAASGGPPGGRGLANVQERLETLYGGSASLVRTRAPGGGARVELHLPGRPAPSRPSRAAPPSQAAAVP